jgi:hypothetical protein
MMSVMSTSPPLTAQRTYALLENQSLWDVAEHVDRTKGIAGWIT